MKTTKNKKDFIARLMEMTDDEINDFIKQKGKPPKPVRMCRIVEKPNTASEES